MLFVGSLAYAFSHAHCPVPKLMPPKTPLSKLKGLPGGAGLSKLTTVCTGGSAPVTVSDAVPPIPENKAVIVTGPPAATPVATPLLLMGANAVELELQAAWGVRFLVEG